tara:strand:- start:339 stop:716 length:378 start_codon:yes stop_codon:yes gene_type:complete
MDVTPLIPSGHQLIHGYGDSGFRISGQRYDGAVLVTPERTLSWPVKAIAEATPASLESLRDETTAIELLLIGCGPRMAMIDPALRAAVREWGIVIDGMDTGAACRTYNVLFSEGRRVAAALLPVP